MANDLVKSGDSGGSGVPALPPGLTGDAGLITQYASRVLTSLKLDDPGDQLLYLAAQERGDMDGRKATGQIVHVEHFILRDATRRNLQSKELEPCPLLTLISPEGEVWSTTSQPAIRSFFMLASLRGLPPWKGGRQLKVKPIRTSLGTDTYILTEAPAGPNPPKSKRQPNG